MRYQVGFVPLVAILVSVFCVQTNVVDGFLAELVKSMLKIYDEERGTIHSHGSAPDEQDQNDPSNDLLYNKTAQEIIELVGFEQETHELITEDGYITELIHLINPLADPASLKQPPVILMHGALVDCVAFMWASSISHHPEVWPRTLLDDGPITSSN